MLGPSDRQPIDGIVSYHIGDGIKRFAKLSQNVFFRFRVLLYPHVHKTAYTSVISEKRKLISFNFW